MPQITFGGLASGLDTSAIIAALVKVEKQPILQLQAQKTLDQDKLDLLSTFEKDVDDLHDKAKALSKLGDFLSYKVTPSEEGVASLTVTGAPSAGNHTLKVNALASSDSWAFASQTSKDTDLLAADDSIRFTYDGTVYTADISAASSSLEDMASAINSVGVGNVTASVINVGTSSTPSYKLVVNGAKTGADFGIAFTSIPTVLGAATNLTTASNASITVDGLTVVRSTNEFSDVVSGLTIAAQAADPAKTISFSVGIDKEDIKKKLHEFVDAYNKVIEFVNAQNTYVPKSKTPALFGDGVLSSVRSQVQKALFGLSAAEQSAIVNSPTGFDTLSIVGIKGDSDGTLTIDDKKLDDKMAADIGKFADLFVDKDGFSNGGITDQNDPGYYTDISADHGVMEKLWREIDQLKSSKTIADKTLPGLFKARKDTIKSEMDRLDDQIAKLEDHILQFQAGLLAKFASLEKIMGGLNAQQAQLTAVFAQLNQ